MNGEDIRRLRERNNWSQKELADAINASLGRSYNSGSVSPWETGKRPIPGQVQTFLQELAVATQLPPSDEPTQPSPGGGDWVAGDVPPGASSGASSFEPQATVGSPSTWTRACVELWELIASAVGMAGAATGNQALVVDGMIIDADKEALGRAWGKLAETNETFRRMLQGMTEGGAWLQVALVTGTTASKCWQNHATMMLTEPVASGNGRVEPSEPL